MFGGVDGTDWQDALWHEAVWHEAVGPSSALWQLGRADIPDANTHGTDVVDSTQKEHFSFILDVGWAGGGSPDARMADGQPGALLEHDQVALFERSPCP